MLPVRPTPPLDNTPISADRGRYIAHAAIPCRDVQEAADWYARVIGASPVRILEDRVTLSVGGVLQLVCHLDPERLEAAPQPYPRHVGLTLLRMADYEGLKRHIEAVGQPYFVHPLTRFPLNRHEHQSFMLLDPSGNVIEFKWYLDANYCY